MNYVEHYVPDIISYKPRMHFRCVSSFPIFYVCFLEERSACDVCTYMCMFQCLNVLVYILGTHYQENQCMTLVYGGQLFISLRPHSISSHFWLSTDTNTYEHRHKHKSIKWAYRYRGHNQSYEHDQTHTAEKRVKALFVYECACVGETI